MQVRVLGSIDLVAEHEVALGGPSQRRILALLAMRVGESVTTDSLVDVTWHDGAEPARAEHNVRSYVHRLRSGMGPAGRLIETVGTSYRLVLPPESLDSNLFGDFVSEASRHLADSNGVAALDAVREAEMLWRGRPYGEFADEAWARAEVVRLEELRITLYEIKAQALLATGQAGEAVACLQAVIESEPLRDRPRALLLRALYEDGRRAEALRAFQDYRKVLGQELGLDPSSELVALDKAIVSDDLRALETNLPRISSAYEVHEQVGQGAFAMVYRATQRAIGRDVAVKIIRSELANRPEFIRRFEAEAQMVASISHPNVVPLYDFWREPDRAYLVMRWMSGGSLEHRLNRGRLGLHETIDLVDDVAAALTAAHASGIIHRDVKPENILFDADDRAALGDFGIALESAEFDSPESALSEGSPIYAAPEQLRQESATTAADVHALGIVAFVALTGHPPFAETTDPVEHLRRQLQDPIPAASGAAPGVPCSVDAVLGMATAKRPDDRFSTPNEFARAFRLAALGEDTISIRASRGSNPYRGLQAFDEVDHALFFGRERLVDELLEHMKAASDKVLAVVGASGAGKSSVVKAGLVPALRSGRIADSKNWFVTSMTPGQRPYEALEAALLRVATNPPGSLLEQLESGPRGIVRGVRRSVDNDHLTVLLVIDQFEELFTANVQSDRRDRFLDALRVAISDPRSQLRVVLTLRADFYDKPLHHPTFAPLLKQHTVVVTPLAPDELEHAIVGPAAAAGMTLAPGLVAEIAADVAREPGSLPLLQYALTQAFERSEGTVISVDDYRAIGGLTGALTQRAEQFWGESTEAERVTTRALFGRLVALGEGTEDSRRRADICELSVSSELESVIDRLANIRLLTLDRDASTREPTVEVAHEALIRSWPRLRGWLAEDRDTLRAQQHVAEATQAWIMSGRDDGELYRGGRLDSAAALAEHHDLSLNDHESEFLATSLNRRAEEVAAEYRRLHRLRMLAATTAVIAVVALIASGLALQQRSNSREQADVARAAEASAELDRLAAQEQAVVAEAAEASADLDRLVAEARNTDATDPTMGILLALAAHQVDPSERTLDAMHWALTARPGYLGALESDRRLGLDIIDIGGARIVTTSLQEIELWDVAARSRIVSWPIPGPRVLSALETDADASDDGSLVAVATPYQTSVLDSSSGEIVLSEIHEPDNAAGRVVALSPSGSFVALGQSDGTVLVRSLNSPDLRLADIRISSGVSSLEWSPSEDMLIVGGLDGSVMAWDRRSESEQWSLGGFEQTEYLNATWGLLFSSDGTRIVMVRPEAPNNDQGSLTSESAQRRIEVREAATGELLGAELPSNRSSEPWIGLQWLDEAEQRVVASSAFGQVSTVDLRTNELDPLSDSAGVGGGLAVLRAEAMMVTAGSTGLELRSLDGVTGPLSRLVPLTPEQKTSFETGQLLIAFGENSTVVTSVLAGLPPQPVRFDLTSANLLAEPFTPPSDRPSSAIVDGFGRYVLNLGYDGDFLFVISDGPSGPPVGSAIRTDRPPTAVSLSEQGDRLILIFDGTVRLYDVSTGQVIADLERVPGAVERVREIVVATFSPDGSYIAIYNGVGSGLFDAATGRTLLTSDTEGYLYPGPAPELLLSANPRGPLQIRDAVTFTPIGEPLTGHAGSVVDVRYAPGGAFLATWGRDETSRVFSMSTGQQFGRELPKPAGNRSNWSPDGSLLAVPTLQGFTLWNYDTSAWPDIACEVASRNLTRTEWEQLGPRTIGYQAVCPQFPLDS